MRIGQRAGWEVFGLMQYLLTAEEYKTLTGDAKAWRSLPYTPDELQNFCTIVADTMPAARSYDDKTAPWGCVISGKSEYCDECPAKEICPYKYKQWSQ